MSELEQQLRAKHMRKPSETSLPGVAESNIDAQVAAATQAQDQSQPPTNGSEASDLSTSQQIPSGFLLNEMGGATPSVCGRHQTETADSRV